MMNNKMKYNKAFMDILGVTEDQLSNLSYKEIESWDSVGHMGLISELETTFDIQFEPDDIVDFKSYEKGLEIMKKYIEL